MGKKPAKTNFTDNYPKNGLKSVLSCDKHRTGGRGRGVECEILRDVEIWFPLFQANVPHCASRVVYKINWRKLTKR